MAAVAASADETAAPQPGSLFAASLRTTSLGTLLLMTMIAFEAMAVAPALPTAARDLHGIAFYGWAFTAFLLANVVGMVAAGQMSDSRGPRAPLVAGMALFVAGLAVAGSAGSMAQLVLGRAVQGAGSGLLITALYVVIGETYPERLRPKVFTATAAAWLLPSLVGPAVSGAVTEHVGWRWVFLGLLPFVALGCGLLAGVLRRLRTTVRPPDGRWLAHPRRLGLALLVAAGVAAFELVGQRPSLPADLLAVAGLVVVALALRGLVPPGTYRALPGVAGPVAMRGLLAGSFFGAESTVPLLLSEQHGVSPSAAGLPLACAGVAWAVGSWWQGREVPGDERQRRVRLLRAGFALVAVAIATAAVVAQPGAPWPIIYVGWACGGLGCGLAMSSMGVLLLAATTDAERGRDSAALQLSDTTASALTTGLAGILVAAAARSLLGYTAAFVVADLVFLVVAGVGVLIAGRAARAAPSVS